MEIKDKIYTVVETALGLNKIQGNENFEKDLEADSLDKVELAFELEEAFDIRIEDGEASKISTVSELVDLITYKVSLKDA